MRHAVLGGGGIGGLLAGALAHSGADVTLVMRESTRTSYDGRLRIQSAVLGDFDVAVPASVELGEGADVLWVATKATQLEAAVQSARPEVVADAFVIPLLNGIDHVALLRRRYANVVAATVRVESERVSQGVIRQKSPFLRVDMVGAAPAQEALRKAGIECRSRDDELAVLWEKLVFLAPLALATTAFRAPIGDVRTDPLFLGCRDEAARAAHAAGARVDAARVAALHEAAPAQMQSSMEKDVAAGRPPELDAIAGPIERGGRAHGFPTDSTAELVLRIRSGR
jgi:2-dehydropantoate 2-reductase